MCKLTSVAIESQNSTKQDLIDDVDGDVLDQTVSTLSEDTEREVWEFMTPMAWYKSVAHKDSIFRPTYQATIDTLRKTAEEGGYDVILEVGCGTGDIIGEMNTQKAVQTYSTSSTKLKERNSKQTPIAATVAAAPLTKMTIPCIGVDINKEFIDFCKKQHPHEACEFFVADALQLENWWKEEGYANKYHKPLVICVNNTLNIMPHELRGGVVDQMVAVAGRDGLCMVSYWNGNFFSHAVMNYYKKNAPLCGEFDTFQHVDWEKRVLVTPTNYSTHWQKPLEVQALLRSYGVDVPTMVARDDHSKTGSPHIRSDALAIFVWFDKSSISRANGGYNYYDSNDADTFYTKIWGEVGLNVGLRYDLLAEEEKAKRFYDSKDAETFYAKIWGNESFHVGRYDLLSEEDKSCLSVRERIRRAGEHHELDIVDRIRSLCLSSKAGSSHGLRVVDMGCGSGGFLRRLYNQGLVWKATGCDVSYKMCDLAWKLNADLVNNTESSSPSLASTAASTTPPPTLEVLTESYLETSVADESSDVVVSIDAFLHTGPEKQKTAIAEASRMLRPGGWMIFSDVMLDETVGGNSRFSGMGTVSNYTAALKESGFTTITTDLHSDNLSTHYGNVLNVTEETGASIGLSEEFLTKATAGLKIWKETPPGTIVWGVIAAQKTRKVELLRSI